MPVEHDGQTAYSVESVGLSVGAHSRPGEILPCVTYERNQNCNPNPNSSVMCLSGEAVRIALCDDSEWIPVKHKRQRRTKALLSSTLHYSDPKALSGRSGIHEKGEVTGEIPTLNEMTDAGNARRRHLAKLHESGKQSLSESAMINENMTNEKSGGCQMLVQSELG